jgi:hypothetical protein
MGFGEKRIFPQSLLRNADENPSPDRYNVTRDIRDRKKGKSFGLAFSYY